MQTHRQVFTCCHQALAWKLADSSQMNRAVQASQLDHFTRTIWLCTPVDWKGTAVYLINLHRVWHHVPSDIFPLFCQQNSLNKNWQKIPPGDFLLLFFCLNCYGTLHITCSSAQWLRFAYHFSIVSYSAYCLQESLLQIFDLHKIKYLKLSILSSQFDYVYCICLASKYLFPQRSRHRKHAYKYTKPISPSQPYEKLLTISDKSTCKTCWYNHCNYENHRRNLNCEK